MKVYQVVTKLTPFTDSFSASGTLGLREDVLADSLADALAVALEDILDIRWDCLDAVEIMVTSLTKR